MNQLNFSCLRFFFHTLLRFKVNPMNFIYKLFGNIVVKIRNRERAG